MKRWLSILIIIALIGAVVYKSFPAEKQLRGNAMGTRWNLQWRGGSSDPGDLKREISGTLEKWEQVLSQWRPDSDLSNFNHGKPATGDLQLVIDIAREIEKQSAGAFDPSLLSDTAEAGFGPEGKGMDLSGIGKGFAVDRVADALKKAGLDEFVFELGGEIVAVGEWEIGIEAPDPAGSSVARTVKLENRALATSGNYRQFKPAPGGLSSHIIDPSTHKPIIREASSVSVIAKDCATADAWATALFVLGPHVPAPPNLEITWNSGAVAKKSE